MWLPRLFRPRDNNKLKVVNRLTRITETAQPGTLSEDEYRAAIRRVAFPTLPQDNEEGSSDSAKQTVRALEAAEPDDASEREA